MGKSPEELRREIEEVRGDLGDKLDAIGDRVSPGRIYERKTERVRGGLSRMRERVMGSPEPSPGVVAGGTSRGIGSAGGAYGSSPTYGYGAPTSSGGAVGAIGSAALSATGAVGSAAGAVGSAAGSAAGAVGSATGTAVDVAGSAVGAVGMLAGTAAHTLVDGVTAAPDAARHQAQGNPFAAGLIAFGAGLLLSTVLPASEREKQAAAKLIDKAQPLADSAKEAAAEVASHLTDTAATAAEGVKGVATSAAEEIAEEASTQATQVADTAKAATTTVKETAADAATEVSETGSRSVRSVTIPPGSSSGTIL